MPTRDRSLPQYLPQPREIDDVDLLRMGVFAPLMGFEGPDGDVSLHLPEDVARSVVPAGALELVDAEGAPLAVLTIESTYEVGNGCVGLLGPVRPLPGVIKRAFTDAYVQPSETRTSLDADSLTVAVTHPLTDDDLARVKDVAAGRPTLFVVLAGTGSPVGVSAHGLIRATLAGTAELDNVRVVAVPVAKRDDDQVDAAFRRRVVEAYAPGDDIIELTGEGSLTAAVQMVVDSDRPRGTEQGLVVFFTGLSGSGKSTIAQALRDHLIERGVRTVSLLDGDLVRRHLSAGLTFSPEDREINIKRIGWVAAEVARHGGMAICSPIAPYESTRQFARDMAEEVGAAFVLVHVATPLEECERRDRKGLYAKARRGEIEQFTGISSRFEIPASADLTVDTTNRTVEDVLAELLSLLNTRGLLPDSALLAETH